MRKKHENPKPASSEKRVNRRTFFFSDGELAAIRQRAGAVRLAEYGRRVMLGQALPAIVPAEHLPLISELGRIGTNLNQLAYRANAAGNAGVVESFDDALAVVLDLRAALRAPAREATSSS